MEWLGIASCPQHCWHTPHSDPGPSLKWLKDPVTSVPCQRPSTIQWASIAGMAAKSLHWSLCWIRLSLTLPDDWSSKPSTLWHSFFAALTLLHCIELKLLKRWMWMKCHKKFLSRTERNSWVRGFVSSSADILVKKSPFGDFNEISNYFSVQNADVKHGCRTHHNVVTNLKARFSLSSWLWQDNGVKVDTEQRETRTGLKVKVPNVIWISLIAANVNLITPRLHHPPAEDPIIIRDRWLLIKLRLMLSNDANLKFMCESFHNSCDYNI